jgi:DNA polymerase-3 subunit epsilon
MRDEVTENMRRFFFRDFDKRSWLYAMAAILLICAFFLFGVACVWLILVGTPLTALDNLLKPLSFSDALLLVFLFGVFLTVAAFVSLVVRDRQVISLNRLIEQFAMAVRADRMVNLPVAGGVVQRSLASSANAVLAQRDDLRRELASDDRVADAQAILERNQLASLMTELNQSVIVCNASGRVLLFNQQAGDQMARFGQMGEEGSPPQLRVGRFITQWFSQGVVSHAVELLRIQAGRRVRRATTNFLTVGADGHVLRIHAAAILQGSSTGKLDGYVLMMHDITAEAAAHGRREAWLYELAQASRARLASLQLLMQAFDAPNLVVDEALALRGRMHGDIAGFSDELQALKERAMAEFVAPPALQLMSAADLMAATAKCASQWLDVQLAVATEQADAWMRVDSYALVQAWAHLCACVMRFDGVRHFNLKATNSVDHVRLELVWEGRALDEETVALWQSEPMTVQEGYAAMPLLEVAKRHTSMVSYRQTHGHGTQRFCWIFPSVPSDTSATAARTPSEGALAADQPRPEFFDFDLFKVSDVSESLEDSLLRNLTYTVFDTETTGLSPSHGDEIIQIGAIRIVNQKLRHTECFDELVNPQRDIPAASTAIHGITRAIVDDAPLIKPVLRRFSAFAADSVLVAHNAAFDMRFLEMKESSTGVQFDQPVLDTLLLASVVLPDQPSHSLRALAQRLGIVVDAWHHALNDAVVTGEIFLKLVPLLEAQGICTLQQARDASKKSYYARLAY